MNNLGAYIDVNIPSGGVFYFTVGKLTLGSQANAFWSGTSYLERKKRSWWAEQGVLEREGAAGVNALLHPGWLPVIPAPSSFRALPSGLLSCAELGRLHRDTPMQLPEARALHTGCGAGGAALGPGLGVLGAGVWGHRGHCHAGRVPGKGAGQYWEGAGRCFL